MVESGINIICNTREYLESKIESIEYLENIMKNMTEKEIKNLNIDGTPDEYFVKIIDLDFISGLFTFMFVCYAIISVIFLLEYSLKMI